MTTAMTPLQASPAISTANLESYMASALQIPVLDMEEEHALALRLYEHNDLDAARTLIIHNLRFVIHVARGYLGYGLPLADLIQEGNVGLMKAVNRFDPHKGVRLVSFAVHWIRAEIHEFVLRNWRIVKVATTKAQRKLFFNLRNSKQRLAWLNREEIDTVARDLGVKSSDVIEMEKRLRDADLGFDVAHGPRRESTGLAPAEYLSHQEDDPETVAEKQDWQAYQEQSLQTALETLDERSRDIITRRWLTDERDTLQDLAAKYGISAERVRQLESSAIKTLKAAVAT